MKGEKSVHSPAQGLTDGFNVGGGGGAGSASWHPDPRLTEKGPDSAKSQPAGTADGPTIGGVGATAGAVPFAQVVTSYPDNYDAGGDPMVGGLGKPPRP